MATVADAKRTRPGPPRRAVDVVDTASSVTEAISKGNGTAPVAGPDVANPPAILHLVVAPGRTVRFDDKPDAQGFWSSGDGRWKAEGHRVKGRPRAVTLTDTTRRAVFADTGASWTRLASWAAVRDMIATHR